MAMPPKTVIEIPEAQYSISATRASGPGGQHVNKVSTAVILKFDIGASSLPAEVKERLLKKNDKRITEDGILVLKSSTHRSQLRNKEAAVKLLHEIVAGAARKKKKRVPTKPSKASVEKRLEKKSRRSEIKAARRKPE